MCGFFMEKLSDAILGIPRITIIGRSEVCIENFHGILEYGVNLIRIQSTIGRICIKGQNLNIEYYSNEEMKVLGLILEIQYM